MSQSDDSLSDEDRACFQAAMQGVKPLLQTKPRVARTRQALPVKRKSASVEKINLGVSCDYAVPYDEVSAGLLDAVQPDSVLGFCRPGVPHRRYRELKQGSIPRRARLDLHGKTVESAYAALILFIESQYQNNSQCVLIIHGRGGQQQGQLPVLKNSVNQWLRSMPQVLAFHSALPRDGGVGAVYVLLKRCRVSF